MLAPWKKSYDQPRQHIKKRNYFANKGPSSQSYDFSSSHVWMWELDYKLKKAEHWRIDAFELCWRRLLRVPWTARRSNQSILKEISPEYSLQALMLKLKLQTLATWWMWRTDLVKNILILGKIEGGRRRGSRGWDCWMASPTRWTWVWVGSGSWWWTGRLGVLQCMGSESDMNEWRNWTELNPVNNSSSAFYGSTTESIVT